VAVTRIDTREELINALTEAAELEHGLLCQYLFAAFSMKKDTSENVTWPQLELIRSWEAHILRVAREEMAHLGTVSNLLTAIGAAPQFRRPNFPQPARYFPEPSPVGARIEDDLEEANDPVTRVALEKRIEELQLGGIRVGILGVGLTYRFAVRGPAEVVDEQGVLGGPVATAPPWPIEFWVGGWDADALCGYMRGNLRVPFWRGTP
jgi:hypothetical protein